jgi:thiol-disulfide isomerase/thioredoxin
MVLTTLLLLGCKNPQLHQDECTRPKVVVFTASWCPVCQQAKPLLAQVKARGVEVQTVDVDINPELARKYGVTSVPMFFVYVCGKPIVRTQDVFVVIALTRR